MNEATVLYVRAQATNTNSGARPGQFGDQIRIMAQPLVSGATLLSNGFGTSMPLSSADMVDLNATNANRPVPFIGRRSGVVPAQPVTAARWIYIGANPGPTNGTDNPAIARYAFWVEDESFKVNLNVAASGNRGITSLGLGPEESRIEGAWRAGGNPILSNADTAGVVAGRQSLSGTNFPTALTAAIPAGVANADAADELRFVSTTHSAGLNLSRGGFKRFNINNVNVIGSNNSAAPNIVNQTGIIRTNLNRVIAAITNTNSVPNFGQRFYRMGTNVATGTNVANINASNIVSANHAAIYLNKVAANILDYIDTDDQPTIINIPTTAANFTNMNDFQLRVGRPEFGIEALGGGLDGTNPVAAMGVENVPRLQEYAIHGRIRELNPIGYNSNSPPPDPVANYRISIDHYFEFWNPGTRDITLTNAFLKIYDQPSFGDNITGVLASAGRPTTEIPVNNVTFPAGRVTVLTTAPLAEINTQLVGGNAANIVILPTPAEDRMFEGETRDYSVGAAFGGNGFNRYFKVSINSRSTGSTDYETAMVLGNNNGILESHVGIPIVRSNPTTDVPSLHFVASSAHVAQRIGDSAEAMNEGNAYYARAGSLFGNSTTTTQNFPTSSEGDPRALNEQLEFRNHLAAGGAGIVPGLTRFYTADLNDTDVPAKSTIGAPNANFVKPTNWVDNSSIQAGAADAPLVVRNGSMLTIGELGHLTDPARVPVPSGALAGVAFSRGGGRTFRVGQPEHPWWYDGNQTNASRTWTSWRLADIFTVKTNMSIPGLINPNGALRDNGAALRAALFGLQYLGAPDGFSPFQGRLINLNTLTTNTLARMTNVSGVGMPSGALNPFWERGEISELSVFNSGTQLTGSATNMANTFVDRGREETVRRSIEMITTRGSVFTVYAIGQSLQGTNVTGTARLKQTFEISPVFGNPATATNDFFNPASIPAIGTRFVAPTNYTTRVIATSYD